MKKFPSIAHRGSILLFALVVSAVTIAITVSFFNYFGTSVHAERYAFASARALALAEAGVDAAIYNLNQSPSYSGETDTSLGAGTYTVSVASIDGSTKRITVTASVPNSAQPIATKTVKVTANINSSVVSFRYGVQIGAGGVSMNNGSTITGNIFSDGNISGSGTITGDATVAVAASTSTDQQWTVQNNSSNIGDTSAHAAVAQSFKPSASASLAGINLYLKKLGNPSDLVIKVVTDNAGKPSTTVLASGVIPASVVTTAYGFASATLDSTPSLTGNQTYWIIAVASVNASNYFVWGRDSNSGYTSGAAKYSTSWNVQSPTWNSITGDLDFQTFNSGILTSLSGVTVQGNAWAHTLSNCSVVGNASYQVISSCSVGGTLNPGATDAAPAPLPISDAQIASWEAIASAGGVIAGPYSPSGTVTIGPKEISGDLTVTNGATLILSGPVWVNGNISLSNNAILNVSPSIGAGGAVLIADATGATATKGTVNISNNVAINGSGSANSFPMIVSTHVGSNAINLSNNTTSVILYAPYGSVDVSNGAGANQVTAYKMDLENNSSVNYVNGLQNATFSNGPGGSWTVVPGTYAITR